MVTWKFRSTSDYGDLNFGSELVKNHEDIIVSVQRNQTLRGATVFFSNVFEFVGAARAFVKGTYDLGGIDASNYLQMWNGNESGHKGSFKRLGDPIKGSFGKTYQLDETTAKMSFASNEFEELILNRFDTEIEYDIEEAIDGQDIGAPIYHDIAMHDRILDGIAQWDPDHNAVDNANINSYVKMNQKLSSIQGTSSIYIDYPKTPFFTSQYDGSEIRINIKNFKAITSNGDPTLVFIRRYDLYDNLVGSVISWAADSNVAIESIDTSITLNSGDTLVFGYTANIIADINYTITFDSFNISLYSKFPPSISKCVLPFEAIDRQIAKITGQKNRLKSNFLGRQNLGYAQDGDGAYVALMNGKLIRSFPTNEAKIKFSLKDLWKTFSDGWNLVAWIKDGYFHIEKYEDYYDLNNVMMLTEAISSLTFNIIEADHFANIKYGFPNASYEEVNELDSFVGLYERQTPLKSVDTKLDLSLPYRADDYGIEFTRRKPYANYPTEGYRTDDEIFLVDCKLNGNMSVITKQGGDGLEVSGILSPNTAYNIDLRPSNLLKNWYNVIASGTYHQVGKMIKFVRGAKNTNLVVDGLSEIRDIEISELGYPLLLPESINFDAKLTIDQFNTIVLEPNKVIGVSKAFGIIDKMDYNPNTGKAEFKLIRANR